MTPSLNWPKKNSGPDEDKLKEIIDDEVSMSELKEPEEPVLHQMVRCQYVVDNKSRKSKYVHPMVFQ